MSAIKQKIADCLVAILCWPMFLANDPGVALIGAIAGLILWLVILAFGFGALVSWLFLH